MPKLNRILMGMLTLALSLAMAGPAPATQVLKDLDDPIRVELQSDVSAANAQVGQEFSAVLNEDVQYANWSIPQGTAFKGAVARIGRSHPLSRPGYVLLQVHGATLPDGRSYDFRPQLYEPRKKRLHHPDAETLKQTVIRQLPYTAVSVGTSVPLSTATDMNRWVIMPIALGARMALGAGMALFNDRLDGHNPLYKMGYGMWEGTGVPRAWKFITKDPEPDFHPGDTIPLYFNQKALELFFKTAASAVSLDNTTAPVAYGQAPDAYATAAVNEEAGSVGNESAPPRFQPEPVPEPAW